MVFRLYEGCYLGSIEYMGLFTIRQSLFFNSKGCYVELLHASLSSSKIIDLWTFSFPRVKLVDKTNLNFFYFQCLVPAVSVSIIRKPKIVVQWSRRLDEKEDDMQEAHYVTKLTRHG